MKRPADFDDSNYFEPISGDPGILKRQRSASPAQLVGPIAIDPASGTLSKELLQPQSSSMPGVRRLLAQAANAPPAPVRLVLGDHGVSLDAYLVHVLASLQPKCILIFKFSADDRIPEDIVSALPLDVINHGVLVVPSEQLLAGSAWKGVSLIDSNGALARECAVSPSLGSAIVLVLEGEVKASMILGRNRQHNLDTILRWSSL